MSTDLQTRPIADRRWNRANFTAIRQPRDSFDSLYDTFGSLLSPDDFRDQLVAELGAGTGHVSRMLLTAGVKHIVAVEPSDAFPALVENLQDAQFRVDCLNCTFDRLPGNGGLDFVFAIDSLHHLPDPRPAVHAAFAALRPGGRIAVTLYSREGWNALLPLVSLTRTVGRHLPHAMQSALAWALCGPVSLYTALCQFLPLPMRESARRLLSPLPLAERQNGIRNDLSSGYTKHYNKMDAQLLLAEAGFCEIEMYHRHGYSWSAVGVKPAE
jgi:SAM-dependent methyltransferase